MASGTAAQALNWNTGTPSFERYNKPAQTYESTTYGFKGFPEMNMLGPKHPMVQPRSADVVHTNKYFREASPNEWTRKQESYRQPSPIKEAQEPMHEMKSPLPPLNATISPRYQDDGPSYSKPPTIRDPLRQMTSAERERKVREHYMAQEEQQHVAQKRMNEKMSKIEEQKKLYHIQEEYKPWGLPGGGAPKPGADNRKTKFTEHQMHNPGSPHYVERPYNSFEDELTYPDPYELRFEGGSPTRMEPMNYDRRSPARMDQGHHNEDMMEETGSKLRKLRDDVEWLKSQDDNIYNRPRNSDVYQNGRAQSEPQTERMYGRNRDRDFYGSTDFNNPAPYYQPSFNNRKPVGRMYYKDSLYTKEFSRPVERLSDGRLKGLDNPNKEAVEAYSPFGLPGGGAPLSNRNGQLMTHIQGSLDPNGPKSLSSDEMNRAQKNRIGEDMRREIEMRKEHRLREKAADKEPSGETAVVVRNHHKVGYPNYKVTGEIANHHLGNTISKPENHEYNTERPEVKVQRQREYYSDLSNQVKEKIKHKRLGQVEERHQDMQHQKTIDNNWGKYGGGNVKGRYTNKVNLNQAIHHPQDSMNYRGGAPYASGMY